MAVDVCGSIEGFRILELGPLESGHTYQLERLGAGSILCIEASPEFYLKSLIIKEILGLKRIISWAISIVISKRSKNVMTWCSPAACYII